MRNPSLQILFKRPTPAIVFPTATKPHVLPAMRNLLASKRGPRPSVFNACHLPMCLARIYAVRALFEHLNFQKMSARGVLCTFWFRNVLPATTACTDSTAPLRRALRASGIFHVLTSKCASCHSGVRFLNISTSKSAPNLKRFCHLDFKIRLAPQRLAIFDLSSDQMTRHPPL